MTDLSVEAAGSSYTIYVAYIPSCHYEDTEVQQLTEIFITTLACVLIKKLIDGLVWR
jgi:hypothetical protein